MDAVDEERLCRRTPVRRHCVKLADCTEPSGLARRHVRKFLERCAAPERVDAVMRALVNEIAAGQSVGSFSAVVPE
ncbi:hypothetical protein [Streptomyces doebereineriae]|uniref:Uncharacterized protein n=1 Tax=Streptomyces doebereineriae TaxID=3075528 RepID=A0ABU2V7B2_9ACTN|nr:hypothetical protein [Streptomyces sp. DSM 41640]MDT0481051.1 hypothetical protein [Streptomyces sp. DSM 41640]